MINTVMHEPWVVWELYDMADLGFGPSYGWKVTRSSLFLYEFYHDGNRSRCVMPGSRIFCTLPYQGVANFTRDLLNRLGKRRTST